MDLSAVLKSLSLKSGCRYQMRQKPQIFAIELQTRVDIGMEEGRLGT